MTTGQKPVRSRPIQVSEVQWQEAQPGLRTRPLWSDEKSGRRAQIVQFDPGARMPMHRHLGHELIYLIEGSLSDEHGTIRPGNVGYRPEGCVHSVSSPHGAVALAVVVGDSEPATEIGGAPPSRVIVPEEQEWTENPNGTRRKLLVANETAGWELGLSRFPPGAGIPLHRHDGDELIFVLEGTSADESGAITPGNMSYRPYGCEHSVSAPRGATFLALIWGKTERL